MADTIVPIARILEDVAATGIAVELVAEMGAFVGALHAAATNATVATNQKSVIRDAKDWIFILIYHFLGIDFFEFGQCDRFIDRVSAKLAVVQIGVKAVLCQ